MSNERQRFCKEVEYDSPEYWETVRLREKVLVHPLGLELTQEALQQENDQFHLVCIDSDENTLGCLVLTPEGSTLRMRQVAVDPSIQRNGAGTLLVKFSEEFAREHGFQRMTMHAREQAVPFYERLGYHRVGEEFEEVGMPHWFLEKVLVD